MSDVELPFRQWLPDQPDLNNPGMVEAKNTYFLDGSYHPQTDIEFPGGDQSKDMGVADTSSVRTAISASSAGVESYAFVLGETTLLATEPQGSSSLKSTAIASGGSTPSDFVNFNGDVYYHNRDSTQYKSTSGFAFALTASNSQFGATSAARVNNFIMTGFRLGIKWSGFNLPESWDVSVRTQAGEATVNNPEFGLVTGIQGGVINYIFQEFGISRLTYIGSPKVWDVRPISGRYGALKSTHIEVGGITYFMGTYGSADPTHNPVGGLYVAKTNGGSVQNISLGAIQNWLRDNFSSAGSPNTTRSVVFDQPRRRIIWSSGNGPGPHKFLCMNVDTEAFSYFEGDYHLLIPGPFHHEDNASNLVGVAPNGGNLHYGPLTGATLEATLTTGHIASVGKRTFVRGAEPQYSGAGATVALSAKNKLRDAGSFSAYGAEEGISGVVPFNVEGRSIATSVKFAAAADWSDLTGAVLDIDGAGEA